MRPPPSPTLPLWLFVHAYTRITNNGRVAQRGRAPLPVPESTSITLAPGVPTPPAQLKKARACQGAPALSARRCSHGVVHLPGVRSCPVEHDGTATPPPRLSRARYRAQSFSYTFTQYVCLGTARVSGRLMTGPSPEDPSTDPPCRYFRFLFMKPLVQADSRAIRLVWEGGGRGVNAAFKSMYRVGRPDGLATDLRTPDNRWVQRRQGNRYSAHGLLLVTSACS